MFFSRTSRHFCSSSTFSSSSSSPSSSAAVVVAAAHILTVSPNPPVRLPLRSSSIAQTRIRFFSNNTNKNEEKKNSNNMSSTGIKQISTDKAMKRKSYFPFFPFSCKRGAESIHPNGYIPCSIKEKLTDTNSPKNIYSRRSLRESPTPLTPSPPSHLLTIYNSPKPSTQRDSFSSRDKSPPEQTVRS